MYININDLIKTVIVTVKPMIEETRINQYLAFKNCCMNLQFYMLVENGVEGKVITGCPQRAVCPSCSSDTGTLN